MKGTLVGSKEGDTTLIAGNTIHSRSSNAIAGGDLNLLAKHIKIDVAGSEDREHSHSEGKSTGFGIRFDPKPSNWRMLFGAAKGFKEAKGDGIVGLAGKGVNAVTQGTIAKFDSPLRINYSHGNSEQDSTIHTYKNSGSNLFAQGKINAVATEGNIDVLGSHLYGGEGINLNAKHDVNILAAGGRTKQESTSKQEVRGLEVGGLTNFVGKIRENGEMNSEQAATLSSRLESKGNINIHAGHHYNQNGSQVDAQGDVAVLAQKINVTAASNPYQGESSYTYQRKGLNIGISTPALDALQETGAAAQRMGQGSGRSSDLMSTATTAYKAYQAYKAVQNMNDPANGINIAATYAVQRSKTENDYHGNTLTPSTINAGGKVYLQAQGAGAESDINITGSDVAGKMGTHLKAEHQINLYAASEEHHENNYNQNYNAAAGVAARAGKNGVALGVTAEGGEGKGYSHANSSRWRGSHIGDADSQTTLQSGEATTLSGSQAIGKGVQIQASALNIESLQDTSDYKGRQEYKGAGGTVGWGYYSGALDYSRSKLQGDAALVNRQAGVYAGDDGFQIDVAGATKNRGGIITSSKAAEEAGLNRFSTATLEQEDIENHRNLKGSSISTSLGYTDGMEQEGQLNRGLGGGYIRENTYDTSRASINTQNITIRDEVAQRALTGESVADTIARANQGIHTEDSAQHGSSLTAIDNGEKLQRQLEADAEITREFGKIAPRAINDIAESRGNLREYEQQQLAKAAAEEALTRTSDPAKRAALQNYINERDSYLAANKANYDYWKEGGSGRNLLHAASTALMSGTPEGALAGYTTSALSPTLNKLDNSLLNAIGGAAIGAAIGGNNPAVIAGAANTDWHNRQLHNHEIIRIKEELAKKFAEEEGISQEEAEDRLLVEAYRTTDEEFRNENAVIHDPKLNRNAASAQTFLRKHAKFFIDEDGEKLLEFAPGSVDYYKDHYKYATQLGYPDIRQRLEKTKGYPQAKVDEKLWNKTWEYVRNGSVKGTANTAIGAVTFPYMIVGHFTGAPSPLIPYKDEIEEQIGNDVSKVVDTSLGVLGTKNSKKIAEILNNKYEVYEIPNSFGANGGNIRIRKLPSDKTDTISKAKENLVTSSTQLPALAATTEGQVKYSTRIIENSPIKIDSKGRYHDTMGRFTNNSYTPTDADIKMIRTNLRVPETQTIAVARTDIAGLENKIWGGASPRPRAEANMQNLDTVYGVGRSIKSPAPPILNQLHNHAEEDLLNNILQAFKENNITNSSLKGKNLNMRITNPLCDTCFQGLKNTDVVPGVIKQFSNKYPDLTINITVENNAAVRKTGEKVLTIKGGKIIEDTNK